jgi:aryl sulfotransferase
MAQPRRYRSPDEDSGRWDDFEFRPGDIVVSTRSKSGTTWMQMICLLLIFGTPVLPGPLGVLSPWLDWLVEPLDSVRSRLGAQEHRRCIKTHTPLDGIPLDARATYIVVVRHPLDLAVSLYHHGDNLNRTRIRVLTGQLEPTAPPPPRPPLDVWLADWTCFEGDPRAHLDTLPGVLAHVADAWDRRDRDNIVLVHYDDLVSDLPGEMRRLATRLGFEIDEAGWPALVQAATFESMRAGSTTAAPDALGVLNDPAQFFRRGRSGEGEAVLAPADLAAYQARVAAALDPELDAWLHHRAS